LPNYEWSNLRLGAKNWKIAIGAYSSKLITPEWKRISQCLKRLWNRKTMYYKMYVRPWPLIPGCKHSEHFCTYMCTDRDYRKKAQIRSVAVQRLGRISKKENKLVNLRYLGYIIAKLQKDTPSSCWDPFTSFNVPTNSHCQRYSTLFNLIVLRRLWTLVHKIFHRC